MARIIVEHLKYQYPLTDFLALNDISFTVEPGEVISIIGANGAGKSSLCEALVGLVPNFYKGTYGGKVLVGNCDIAKSKNTDICTKVGLVLQNPFNQVTACKLTVYEEIAFGLENMGLPSKEMHKRIDDALKLLNLEPYKNQHPFDLSGGQMQRMAIAGVIAMKPEVIVLDESTSQLDPQGSEEVYKTVQDLAGQGMTVIMASHKIEMVARYSTRVMLLHKGKLVDFDTPHKIFSREDLNEYGVNRPIFTEVCRELKLKLKENGLYPVTLEEATRLIKQL